MILPANHLYSLLLLVLSFLCWGSWANTFNAAGKKWRFELYYFDFAVGVLLAAIICAATVGSLGWDGFSFVDDVRLAGKRQDFFAFGAGIVFNLGNMLLVAAISVVGISVAFPIGVGLSLVIGTFWAFVSGPAGSLGFRMAGMAALIVAIVASSMAYRAYAKAKLVEAIQTGRTKSTKKVVSSKGIALAIAGGVFLGCFLPLLDMGRATEIGLGPYSLGFVFAIGILVSTFVFNLFFMNLPVVGKPIDLVEYFRAKAKLHLYGLLGGMVFYIGALAAFVVDRAEGPARIDPSLAYALSEGGVVLAVVWGLLLWKELSGTDSKVNYQLVLMMIFLLLGIGLLSAAPAFAPK
jgi:glucose uptake protein